MAQQKSNKQTSGRYVQGGSVEDFGLRLGWWEPVMFKKSPTDVPFYLESKYNMRPDLLAFDLYGKSGLAWFILQYNLISDVSSFITGIKLVLPTRVRLFSEILTRQPTSVV